MCSLVPFRYPEWKSHLISNSLATAASRPRPTGKSHRLTTSYKHNTLHTDLHSWKEITYRIVKHAHQTATMAPNMSLFSVNAILLLAADDNSRILTKYYSPPHPPANVGNNYPGANPYPGLKDQKAFEKGLLEKTAKSTNDVILYDNRIVVYKTESDVMLYVVGPPDENEIMLYNVVLALRDSLNILLK
jgi:hypothetical protein